MFAKLKTLFLITLVQSSLFLVGNHSSRMEEQVSQLREYAKLPEVANHSYKERNLIDWLQVLSYKDDSKEFQSACEWLLFVSNRMRRKMLLVQLMTEYGKIYSFYSKRKYYSKSQVPGKLNYEEIINEAIKQKEAKETKEAKEAKEINLKAELEKLIFNYRQSLRFCHGRGEGGFSNVVPYIKGIEAFIKTNGLLDEESLQKYLKELKTNAKMATGSTNNLLLL